MPDRDRDFGDYVDARTPALRRTAFLLCGDWHRADDLVQTALVKLYVAWPRVQASRSVDAYARQVLVRSVIDESRRGFRRHERVTADVPDVPACDAVDGAADDVDVRRALAALPPGQRAVVVLRYWEDLPVRDTAALLRCSEGTVKSQASKGLVTLRRLLAAGRPVLEER